MENCCLFFLKPLPSESSGDEISLLVMILELDSWVVPCRLVGRLACTLRDLTASGISLASVDYPFCLNAKSYNGNVLGGEFYFFNTW